MLCLSPCFRHQILQVPHGDGTCAPRMPQAHHSKSGNMKLQIPLHQRANRSGRQLPNAVVGLAPIAGRDNTQSPTTIQCVPNGVRIHPLQLPFQLKKDAAGTNGMHRSGPQEDGQERNLGLPLPFVHIARTPLSTRVSYEGNQEQVPDQDVAIQPQPHLNYHHHTHRQSKEYNL